jgi:diguanylate cyclase (GGDEF)-like protein
MSSLARNAVQHLCGVVVDGLAEGGRLLPSVYLERGGRLRCQAVRGYWQVFDGMPPGAGVIGRCFRTGKEVVIRDIPNAPEYMSAAPGIQGEVCVPLRIGGEVVGVLNAECVEPLTDADVESVRRCAGQLEQRIAQLGGAPPETGAERLARHASRLAAVSDPVEAEGQILDAAIDVGPFDSCALVMQGRDGSFEPRRSAGPLGAVLWAAGDETFEELAAITASGSSCFTRGEAAESEMRSSARLRADGVRGFAALGIAVPGGASGLLLLASCDCVTPVTEDIERLELLSALAGACLRNAELVGELRERAATDPLTGLGHHATFQEALAGRPRQERAVLLIDVDGFKRFNDTHGHQAGDRALRETAASLTGALRHDDRLYRIGGDEFAAIVTVRSNQDALEVGRLLRDSLKGGQVTASIGIAIPRPNEPDDSVLRRADRAMYAVKEAGRDGVLVDGEGPGTDPLFVG